MRSVRWARWVAVVAATGAGACGSDSAATGSTKCGPGTVLSGDECVPQCAEGTTLQGVQCVPVAGSAGSGSGSAGAGAQQAGAGNGVSGDSGAPNGDSGAPNGDSGAPNGDSGAPASSGAGGTSGTPSVGGSGGTSGAVAMGGSSGVTNGGMGGALGTPGPTHWLTFAHSDGVFLYDTAQFPDNSQLVKLTSHAPAAGFAVGPFSPDGRLLAYVDGGDLYVRDVSSNVPGPALLLLDEAAALDVTSASGQHCYWSPDSKSLAFVSRGVVYVMPVDHPAPNVQRLFTTTSSPFLDWSANGNKLAVDDNSSVELVTVNAGSIVSSTTIANDGFRFWSPDGSSFVGLAGSSLILTDVAGAAPVLHVLGNSNGVLGNSSSSLAYNATGSILAFLGVERAAVNGASQVPPDLYTVTLQPTLGTPTRVTTALDAWTGATSLVFSPNGDRLAYLTQTIGSDTSLPVNQQFAPTYTWTIAAVTSGALGASIGLATQTISVCCGNQFVIASAAVSSARWQPNGATLVTSSSQGSAFSIFAPPATTAVKPSVTYTLGDLVFSPRGSVVAGSGFAQLSLTDVSSPPPQGQIGAILNVAPFSAPGGGWGWSTDGKFIATTLRSTSAQMSITRVDGTNVSTPIGLYPPTSTTPITFFWQP